MSGFRKWSLSDQLLAIMALSFIVCGVILLFAG